MKKLDGLTADVVAERIEELRTVFPEVFKDGKIDFDSLLQGCQVIGPKRMESMLILASSQAAA